MHWIDQIIDRLDVVLGSIETSQLLAIGMLATGVGLLVSSRLLRRAGLATLLLASGLLIGYAAAKYPRFADSVPDGPVLVVGGGALLLCLLTMAGSSAWTSRIGRALAIGLLCWWLLSPFADRWGATGASWLAGVLAVASFFSPRVFAAGVMAVVITTLAQVNSLLATTMITLASIVLANSIPLGRPAPSVTT